ncbi:titin-like [Clavelina lepadiformis]|uniref:titin-like n=1 Tax=Clavelina lepadiformis TaxID=159417 RepID=UPI004042C7DE
MWKGPKKRNAESSKFFDLPESNVLLSQPAMAMKQSKERRSPLLEDKILNKKPAFELPLRDTWVEVKHEARFVTEVTGTPTPLITWLHDDEVIRSVERYQYIKAGNVHTLVVPRASDEDAGIITCRATNKVGQSESTARLIIITPDVDSSSLTDDATVTFEDDSSVNVTVVDSMELARKSHRKTTQEESDLSTLQASSASFSKIFAVPDDSVLQRNMTADESLSLIELNTFDASDDHTNSAICPQDLSTTSTISAHQKKQLPRLAKKTKPVRRKTKSIKLNPSDVDWTEKVRMLIKEEIEIKETERQLQEGKEKNQKIPTVEESTPKFLQTISDCNVGIGETAHFVYILASIPSADVMWMRNGAVISLPGNRSQENDTNVFSDGNIGIISDEGAGCLIISESELQYSGVYTCMASNVHGSAKCSATLVVTGKKNIEDNRTFIKDAETNTDPENKEVDPKTQLVNPISNLVDREAQTNEVRVAEENEEDQMISDAFKQLETAEKMQVVAEVVIDDSLAEEKPSETKPGSRKSAPKKTKKKKQSRLTEQSMGLVDDNETGEGLMRTK